MRPCCTFTPASRCKISPALTVQIGNVDVSCAKAFRRKIARIDARAAVMEFVAAPMRQQESNFAVAHPSQFRR